MSGGSSQACSSCATTTASSTSPSPPPTRLPRSATRPSGWRCSATPTRTGPPPGCSTRARCRRCCRRSSGHWRAPAPACGSSRATLAPRAPRSTPRLPRPPSRGGAPASGPRCSARRPCSPAAWSASGPASGAPGGGWRRSSAATRGSTRRRSTVLSCQSGRSRAMRTLWADPGASAAVLAPIEEGPSPPSPSIHVGAPRTNA
mmetsp:Transcript_54449/g.146881  ORF Transcript_54449/g.146881 Transcript_54449/m.146881 type:complete len:203 (-) Transcript_54449:191-799(-)